MDTSQASPKNHGITVAPTASEPPSTEDATIEGDSKGETYLALLDSLSAQQQTYLGAIRQRRRESVAISHAGITPPILASWRNDAAFSELERLLKAKAWGLGKRLAVDIADAESPAIMRQMIHDAQHAPTARERVPAGRTVLEAVRILGAPSQQQGASVSVGSMIVQIAALTSEQAAALLQRTNPTE